MAAARIARLELWVQLGNGVWDLKDTITPSAQKKSSTSVYKCMMILRNRKANRIFYKTLPYRIYIVMTSKVNRDTSNVNPKLMKPVIAIHTDTGQIAKRYVSGRLAEREELLKLDRALYRERTRAGGYIWLFESELYTDFMEAQIERFKRYDEKVLKRKS